ncbi:class I SAM-dependent methyltransferase [Chloroflexi bacterium TSY]|nr:class I SAM-dependent methyltransferase [Chloroflexi bacterium TSY]
MQDSQAPLNLLSLLYETEQTYGWSVGMRQITHRLLENVPIPFGLIIEVGCGGGTFAQELAKCHPEHSIVGSDISARALTVANQHRTEKILFTQADLEQMPFGSSTAACIVALDSFDQQGIKLQNALAESYRVLEHGGLLFTRVSAHEWLWAPHDRAFNTGRRYGMVEFVQATESVGFNIERATYANTFLLFPITLQRWLQRKGWLVFESSLYTNQIANYLVRLLLSIEASWLRRYNLPTGISLFVMARKNHHS